MIFRFAIVVFLFTHHLIPPLAHLSHPLLHPFQPLQLKTTINRVLSQSRNQSNFITRKTTIPEIKPKNCRRERERNPTLVLGLSPQLEDCEKRLVRGGRGGVPVAATTTCPLETGLGSDTVRWITGGGFGNGSDS